MLTLPSADSVTSNFPPLSPRGGSNRDRGGRRENMGRSRDEKTVKQRDGGRRSRGRGRRKASLQADFRMGLHEQVYARTDARTVKLQGRAVKCQVWASGIC